VRLTSSAAVLAGPTKEVDTKSIRGTLYRWTTAKIFRKQDLTDSPNGSEIQMAD
jgi:hypothetical protein